MSAGEPSKQPTPTKRGHWRWLRLAAWLLFLSWFSWFAYVRWTTPPAALQEGRAAVEEENAAVSELVNAMAALPPYVPIGRGPRGGWGQPDPLCVALQGEWDPAARRVLADVIKHLTSSNVSGLLDQVVGLCGQLHAPARLSLKTAAVAHFGDEWTARYKGNAAVAALTARVRLKHAGRQDLAGALSDLRAAIVLESSVQQFGAFGYTTDALATMELCQLSREVDLPRAVADEMIHLLSGQLSLSLSETLLDAALGGEAGALLDRHYTDDGQGNGWLVISSLPRSSWIGFSNASETRCGLWNIASPLFNDRRTVAAKLAGLGDSLRRVDDVDLDEIVATLKPARARLSLLDGPLADMHSNSDSECVAAAVLELMWRRAAVVMVSLSAYTAEHGEYPDELAGLAPEYLAELPMDLLTNADFVYRCSGVDAFELRSDRIREPDCISRFGVRFTNTDEGLTYEYTRDRPAADE